MKEGITLAILPEELTQEDFSFDISKDRFLAIYISKSDGYVEINKFNPYQVISDPKEETVIEGNDFSIKIYNSKGEVIYQKNFNLSGNKFYDTVVVPYFLNIDKIILLKNNLEVDKLENVFLPIKCNENGVCEPGEENLCPLDCKNTKNPYYPLTSKIEGISYAPKYTTSTFYYPPPSNIFKNILLTSVIFIVFILGVVFIIYLIKRRR